MKSYLISYDLIGPNRDYDSVTEKIKSYGTWARPLESVWIIKTDDAATTIRDNIASVMDSNDKLIVVQLSGTAAWRNLSDEMGKWLKENL
ncbi:CRISPR-associated protein Cas2 [Cytobacillus firmus]|uniref:CRISPR-associated protein Cas2 n=1 Tax=Cytobacillus firmus TaxID=1399 RepID=UPI0020792476|nr:CRISPR-associated protein Cas2 [Cytobacillus firmus]USK40153.1 CRISPR-associated protein Cas2 [Cytobacillus firmus]